MKLRVTQQVIGHGPIIEPGVGDFDPVFGQHLVDIGAAEVYETKIIEGIQTKKPDLAGSASQAAPASRKRTARKSKAAEKS